jgi:hypothetical protein
MNKTCRQCLTWKPLEEFYLHPQMADGHLNKCKQCVKIRVGEHRELNLERIRAYDRSRGRRRAISGYPKKQKNAATRVGRAILKGLMKRKPCVICGNVKSEGHHQDYDKPYDVVWLCPEHHRRLHAGKFTLIPLKH